MGAIIRKKVRRDSGSLGGAIGQLTDEEIDQMFDAEGYAEKQRYFGI